MNRPSSIQRTLRSYLSAQGLKRTRQRELILSTLVELQAHVTMEQLAGRVRERHPKIGQATVYRAVKLFEDAGILMRHSLRGAQVHYELTAPDAAHHDHIVCVTCGRIFEFVDPEIEARQEALARRFGMRALSHVHVIRGECLETGRCDDCAYCHPEEGD